MPVCGGAGGRPAGEESPHAAGGGEDGERVRARRARDCPAGARGRAAGAGGGGVIGLGTRALDRGAAGVHGGRAAGGLVAEVVPPRRLEEGERSARDFFSALAGDETLGLRIVITGDGPR